MTLCRRLNHPRHIPSVVCLIHANVGPAAVLEPPPHYRQRPFAIEQSPLYLLDIGQDRLEAACGRALDIGARSHTSATLILKNNMDRSKLAVATDGPAIFLSNICGPR